MWLLPLLISSASAAPTYIVVDAVDTTDKATLDQIAYDAGMETLDWVSDETHDEALAIGITLDANRSLEILDGDSRVEVAEEQIEFRTLGIVTSAVNDPDFGKQWHMVHPSIDAEWVWSHTGIGDGVIVAVLDTGLTVTSDTNPEMVLDGISFVSHETVRDRNGHGTHCASTISEWTNNNHGAAGLAYRAKILPVKVLSDYGSGGSDGIAAGIDWAVDNGADVISMSLGSSSPSKVIHHAIDKAIAKGVVVVAAAGNSGAGGVGFPGGYDPVIGVGSIGPTGDRAPYSSYGGRGVLDIMAPGGDKSHKDGGVWQYTAPGGKEGLYEFQGTSMATPHVAAAVAVLLGEGACPVKDSARQACMDELLKSTATPPPRGKEKEFGHGTINLKAAVQKISQTDFTTVERLPWASPAGNLTYVIMALTLLGVWFLSRFYAMSKPYLLALTVAAIASSGSLYFLTLVPTNLHALSMFIVPWLEFPEYLLGPGASGFFLWLSVLPLLPWFFLAVPFKVLRPMVTGVCLSTCAYFTTDLVFMFNPPWWLGSTIGEYIWLSLNTLAVGVMVFFSCEYHRVKGGGE